MYRTGMLATLVAVLAGVLAPGASAATAPITESFNDCPVYPGGDHICSGEVPSFDPSKLDVDLTLPTSGSGAKHPLIVMLHGFGNNKHEWESTTDDGDGADKHHWNNHWFARHGYYVLNYTARGFRDDGPTDDSQPGTPAGTSVDVPSGTLRVKSRDFEIKDTQWLAALVAAAHPDVDPEAIAVTGGSYGGGESWVQASQADWTFPHKADPALPVLHLQVAVPKYPWTDLAYALAPNGHGGGPAPGDVYESAQGRPDSDTGAGNPIGVPKASYITGLFARGVLQGVFEEGLSPNPGAEGPVNIPLWNTRLVGVGDPYPDPAAMDGDPIVAQARRGLTEFRSAYYQDEGWLSQRNARKVAIFSIQGWTDDLFEAVESFREFKYLKRLDPNWPVEVALGDIGHSRAQNKPATWQRLNSQAWQWLQSNINGSHEQSTTVSSEQTVCDDSGGAMRLTAKTPEGLSAGSLAVAFAGTKTLTQSSGAEDPDGPATDPIVGGLFDSAIGNQGPCRVSTGRPSPTRFTGLSEPLQTERTYIGLGTVTVPYTFNGSVGSLDARVWDVPPDGGKTLLITRGTYRLDMLNGEHPDTAGPGSLTLPLYGNHWRLAPGHRIRLDLAEVDEPTFRPTNTPNTLTLSDPVLTLPTRSAGDLRLAGAGS